MQAERKASALTPVQIVQEFLEREDPKIVRLVRRYELGSPAYFYAFLKPAAYRHRLGQRHFAGIARLVLEEIGSAVTAEAVRADYVARGGMAR